MDVNEIFILIIVVSGMFLYGLAIYRFFKKDSKTSEYKREEYIEPSEDKKDYTSTIHYSKSTTQNKETNTIINHKIVVILKDSSAGREKKWLCPECEIENSISEPECCVCNYHYEKLN